MKVLRLVYKGTDKEIMENKNVCTFELHNENSESRFKDIAVIVVRCDESERPLDKAIKCVKELMKNQDEDYILQY